MLVVFPTILHILRLKIALYFRRISQCQGFSFTADKLFALENTSSSLLLYVQKKLALLRIQLAFTSDKRLSLHSVYFQPSARKQLKRKMEIVVKFSLIILVIISIVDGFTYQRIFRQSEICGYHNGHRKYLELGESGKLSGNNITVPNVREFIDFSAFKIGLSSSIFNHDHIFIAEHSLSGFALSAKSLACAEMKVRGIKTLYQFSVYRRSH